MRYLLIFLFSITLYSCDKRTVGFNLDAIQDFHVQDKEGNDLLNQDNSKAININKIKIYYLIGNKKILVADYLRQIGPNVTYDNYNGYLIREYKGMQTLMVYLNTTESENRTTYTFIEWDENDTDTIKSKIVQNNEYGLVLRMVEYNNTKVEEGEQFFTIVK